MSEKCVACRRGHSVSVGEPGVPALCRSCWERAGDRIRVGIKVVFTENETNRGTVRKIDVGNIVVIDCDDGGEAWIPTPLLIAVRA